MQELHGEAAEQIFREKNDGCEPGEIDLDGLFVKEALSRLSQFIREAATLSQTNPRGITGKGLSSEGDPQILPDVEDSRRKKGLRHHTDEANAGVIVVELGPRSPVFE
ncbi:Smr domain protein [Ceratobasidium sp. AG-Ba]|nr:Smr domain protein [Ceratobasidium sp. AG-Ba]QRV98610.1 Smr domain protein [Ceratobasidium sp. AG-Ba]